MGIVLEEITKSFGDPPAEVLKGISLTVNDGEFVAISGRSGSGKSTLLYIMSTLDQATSGRLAIDGREVNAMTSRDIHHFRNLYIGFVFQFHYLLPELTVLENVLLPARKTREVKARQNQALHLLQRFGIDAKKNKYPRQLSGGESQRVGIARALVMSPRYLFADEPTGNLDTVNGDLVMALFSEINKTQNTTIVMVTHDPDYAALANRQVHLVDGRIADS